MTSLYRRHESRQGVSLDSADEFAAWQDGVREYLRDVLGLTAIARSDGECEPALRRVDVEHRNGFVQQKWTTHTETEFHVPFYVLLPEEREPPYPTVFAVHGHNEIGKDLAVGRPDTAVQHERVTDERRDTAV